MGVASVVWVWRKRGDLVGGKGVKGAGCRGVVVEDHKECGVGVGEGRG